MTPNSLDPRSPLSYRRRARPIIFVGYLVAVAGLSAILHPHAAQQTTVAHLLSPTAELTWQLAYAIGGLLMVCGAGFARPSIEVTGLWLTLYGLAVNVVALFVIRGFAGSGLALVSYALTGWVIYGRISDLHASARTERRQGPRFGARYRWPRS